MAQDTYRKSDFRKAKFERIKDAESLKGKRRYHSMVYLIGFAVECAFAEKICSMYQKENLKDIPGFEDKKDKLLSHNLMAYIREIKLVGLEKEINKLNTWWKVGMRYRPNDFSGDKSHNAIELFELAIKLLREINATIV